MFVVRGLVLRIEQHVPTLSRVVGGRWRVVFCDIQKNGGAWGGLPPHILLFFFLSASDGGRVFGFVGGEVAVEGCGDDAAEGAGFGGQGYAGVVALDDAVGFEGG